MKKITDIPQLKGVRVIVRASLNIPLEDGTIRNAFRLERALPTLRYLHEQGAKTIIIGHIGRGKEDTLKPIYDYLSERFPMQWGGAITSESFATHAALLSEGTFLMAENLRQDEREEENDIDFAKCIANYGDIYINDAFAEVHREHASLHALATLLPAYAGLNLLDEINHLTRVMVPEHPSLFLLGGAKFETKMPLVAKYLELYDHVFISGALMSDVFKAKGYEVGLSLVSDVSLVKESFLESEKLILPVDVVVDGPSGTLVKAPTDVAPNERIMDCGPETIALLKTYINEAKTVLWNGPFGNYEHGYTVGTVETMKTLAAADAFSVVGGGDTVASIQELGLNDKIGFVSIGGGAMLTYLEHGSTSVLDLLN